MQNEKFKESLIKSLERGNLQSTTFLVDGKEEKIFLSANPAFKSLNAFDENKKSIKLSDLMQNQKQEQSNKQDNRQTVSEKQSAKKETTIRSDKESPLKKKVKSKRLHKESFF